MFLPLPTLLMLSPITYIYIPDYYNQNGDIILLRNNSVFLICSAF